MLTVRILAFFGLCALHVLSGCARSEPAADNTPAQSAPPPQPEAARLPPVKNSTLALEGDEEPITLQLFESGSASLPVSFTTYVPADMIAQPGFAGDRSAVRFVANFGGKREQRAYMEVAFYPSVTGETTAKALLAESAASESSVKENVAPDKRFAWSVAEYEMVPKTRGGIAGVAVLGSHGDRLFEITLHYPEEFAEGFVPRAYRILAEWRWTDTNQGL